MPGCANQRVRIRAVVVAVVLAVASPLAMLPGVSSGAKAPGFDARLGQVHALIAADRNEEALAENRRLADARLDSHQRALVDRTFGVIYVNLGRYREAASHLQACIESGSLPVNAEQDVRHSLAGIHATLGRWERVIATFGNTSGETALSDEALVMLAQAYAKTGKHAEAVSLLERVLLPGSVANASWYELLVAEYLERDDYSAAVSVLRSMIGAWPENREYWVMLAGCHQRMAQGVAALSVLELGYRRGVLVGEDDILTIARMGLANGVPYRTAQLLEREIGVGHVERNESNLRLLETAWMQAREFDASVEVLRELIRMTGKGNYRTEAVKRLYACRRWQEVVDSGLAAIRTGDVGELGDLLLLVGIAQIELRQFRAARRSLVRAARSGGVAGPAQVWIDYVDSRLRESGDSLLESVQESGG